MFAILRFGVAASTALASAALIVACGGGGSDSTPTPPVATTATISGLAADGPLQGATACYDLNDDGICQAGEPTSAATGADGKFALDVPLAEAGKHRVVVNVPATAIDKDTGAAVGTAFTLVAPPTGSSAAVFVSPLTTLVQAQVDTTGATPTAAADFIKAQAGLAISPLADFTAVSNADNKLASNVSRLVVLTTQKQLAAVTTGTTSVIGTASFGGSTISITPADVSKAIAQAVIAALPGVAAAAADPAVAGASGAALQTALNAASNTVVSQIGLTPAAIVGVVGVAKQPADTSAAALGSTASLTALRYTNANDWFVRTLESSAADTIADANGFTRYYSVYKESVPFTPGALGTVRSWNGGPTLVRAGDLHWNGSAWVGCPLGTRSESSKRDASGRNTYDYCLKQEGGSSLRSAVDLTAKTLSSVLQTTIRTFPGGANGVDYSNWGPADLSILGTATFPTGSKLYYQTNTTTQAAPTYDVTAPALILPATIAAGGDARAANPPCNAVTPANTASFQTPAATLDEVIARNPGKPCFYNTGTNSDGSSGAQNEWWGNSTVSIGDIAGSQTLPAGTGNYYATTGNVRIGYAGTGNAVTYYHCLRRRIDNSPRNCAAIGTGSYAIATLGDARVMTFSAAPALAQRVGYNRVFVERGGKVYVGYATLLGSVSYLRLNLEAANAFFERLDLPPIRPVTRAGDFSAATAAAFATAKGVYGGFGLPGADAFIVRFGDNGRYLSAQAVPMDVSSREQSGAELGFLDLDTASGKISGLIEVDSDATAGASHPAADENFAISATQLVLSSGGVSVSVPRLAGGSSGVLGLWAIGSATDLSVVHLAFFGNGKMMLIDSTGDTSASRCGPPGVEYASYTLNAGTGALRVYAKVYDTNGCAGLFDTNTESNATLVFAADGKTATVSIPGEGTFTIYRIASQ